MPTLREPAPSEPLVAQLVHGIAAAAHDVELEDTHQFTLLHFLDSDALIRTIFGYRALAPAEVNLLDAIGTRGDSKKARETRLLRQYRHLFHALLNFYVLRRPQDLPELRILQPHLSEFTRKVHDDPPTDDPAIHAATLRVLGTKETLDALLDKRKNEGYLNTAIREYLSDLAKGAPEVFWGIDLLSPQPHQRLGLLLDAGLKQATPFDVGASIFNHSYAANIRERLDELRAIPPESLRQRSQQNDAAAIAMIMLGISRQREERNLPLIRFYTETEPVRKLLSTGTSADLCTYPTDSTHDFWPASVHSCLRNEFYYLVRMVVPTLLFGKRTTQAPSNFLKDVRGLAWLIETETDQAELDSALDDLRAGGSSLVDLIDEFADLSFLQTVWPDWLPTAKETLHTSLRELGVSLSQLDSLSHSQSQYHSAIVLEIGRRQKQIESRTHQFATFGDIYANAFPAIHNSLAQLASSASALDDLSDALGLSRFGLRRDERRIVDIAKRLLAELIPMFESASDTVTDSSEARGESRTAGEVAGQSRRVTSELAEMLVSGGQDDFLAALALLFAVFADEAAAQAVDYGVREAPDNHASNEVDCAIAILGSISSITHYLTTAASGGSVVLLEQRVAELNSRLASMSPPDDRLTAALLLGRARVFFDSWYSLNPVTFTRTGRGSQTAVHLLHESFRLAGDALQLLNRGDPLYAWLVNFLLYGGTIADIHEPRPGSSLEELAEELISLRSIQHLASPWSYRFADTLAYYFFLGAHRAFERQADALVVHEFLSMAEDWMEMSMGPLDDEVSVHSKQIRAFRARLQQRALDAAGQ
jgi:hypothetical protein